MESLPATSECGESLTEMCLTPRPKATLAQTPDASETATDGWKSLTIGIISACLCVEASSCSTGPLLPLSPTYFTSSPTLSTSGPTSLYLLEVVSTSNPELSSALMGGPKNNTCLGVRMSTQALREEGGTLFQFLHPRSELFNRL